MPKKHEQHSSDGSVLLLSFQLYMFMNYDGFGALCCACKQMVSICSDII
jgi:hypothetical protein